MFNQPNALTPQQQLRRLQNRLNELAGWRDHSRQSAGAVQFTDASGKNSTIQVGEAWPSRDFPVTFEASLTVPEAWRGQPVALYADAGGETLVTVNGQALGGLNPYHREHLLLPEAQGDEQLQIALTASPKGLFGTPERTPALRGLRLLVPDAEVRDLYEDLLAALDGAGQLLKLGRDAVATRVLDVVNEAFTRLPLPRDHSQAYLARVSLGEAERKSLDSLWDEYDFEQPDAAPYPDDLRPALQSAKKVLADGLAGVLAQYPAEGQVALTGHAHIDLAWLWPLAETRRKVLRTFGTVLTLMEQYPDFKFNQSMGQLYEFVLEEDPALFERIKARVAEGRWDLVGGMWVEPDGNLISGESWARQLLHGQRFFQKHFGKTAKVCWLPDTFGYTANLPQFLQQGGIPSFFTIKLTWNETNPFPYDLYLWEALDGTRVLAHSFANPGHGYNAEIKAWDVSETWNAFRGKRTHAETLLSFGYGDGGGGPTWEGLERYERLKAFPSLPKLHMTTVADFYARVDSSKLPVWVGEQYFELHRGTYTTQGKVKWLNRKLEIALGEAEAACALAARTVNADYPRDTLYGLWKVLLRNHFHDILPGSSVRAVYEVAHQEMAEALSQAETLRDAALQSMSAHVPGSGEVAWNLSLETRECRGVSVPPLGYARVPAASPLPDAPETDMTLENEFLRVTINADGTIGSLYDKQLGREALAGDSDGLRGNQLWAFVDVPRQWEAWDVDATYAQEGRELKATQPPVRRNASDIEVTRKDGDSRMTQTYRLEPHSRRLDIITHAHWTGRRSFLRAYTQANVRASFATFETAYGSVERSTHTNTGWDTAQFEVPAHRWADLSEGDFGLSLLNDSKYGHSIKGNTLGLSLLRGPLYPDPTADEGEHHFVYSLYPHAGDWRGAGMESTPAQAADLNAPLRLVTADGEQGGDWPAQGALLSVTAGRGIRLGALKLAEDADQLIVRLYDAQGTRGTLSLETGGKLGAGGWQAVNFLEEATGDKQDRWEYSPYRVVSLREV